MTLLWPPCPEETACILWPCMMALRRHKQHAIHLGMPSYHVECDIYCIQIYMYISLYIMLKYCGAALGFCELCAMSQAMSVDFCMPFKLTISVDLSVLKCCQEWLIFCGGKWIVFLVNPYFLAGCFISHWAEIKILVTLLVWISLFEGIIWELKTSTYQVVITEGKTIIMIYFLKH